MEEKRAKVRINFSGGEIEIEGSEAFVREYIDKFEDLLEFLRNRPQPPTIAKEKALPDEVSEPLETDMPEVFGEYLQRFPRSIKDIDRVLIAAYFVQSHDSENCFTTRSANKLLTEQGFKVANASDCIKKSVRTKRVFAVPSLGRSKYRVSQTGVEYINGLLES